MSLTSFGHSPGLIATATPTASNHCALRFESSSSHNISYHISNLLCACYYVDIDHRCIRSQPNAKTQKSTKQFPELDGSSHGAGVVGQSVPGGRTRMCERPLAELRAQP